MSSDLLQISVSYNKSNEDSQIDSGENEAKLPLSRKEEVDIIVLG